MFSSVLSKKKRLTAHPGGGGSSMTFLGRHTKVRKNEGKQGVISKGVWRPRKWVFFCEKIGITISCEIWYCRGGYNKNLNYRAHDAVIETPIYSHENVYDRSTIFYMYKRGIIPGKLCL